MATLSPFGFLLIFLGIQLAPSSTLQITIQMDQHNLMIFAKEENGEWKRVDRDAIAPVTFKVEKTSVVAKGPDGKKESYDLAENFHMTGKEHWKEIKIIRSKSADPEFVTLLPQDHKIIVELSRENQKFKSEIIFKTEDDH